MPTWIKTRWYHLSYGYEVETKKGGWFSNGTTLSFCTPLDTLQQVLEKFTDYMDSKQATIKAVLPLTTAVGHYNFDKSHASNASYGYGYGYGVTPTVGAIVIAQQEREVSAEEYQRLTKIGELKDKLPDLQSQCEQLQQTVDADMQVDTSIQEKKKLLGGVRFYIADREFSSEAEAKVFQAELLSQAAVNQQALDTAKLELHKAQEELENLKKTRLE